MVGLLGKVSAGLVLGGAKGYGEALVEDGKTKREKMLMEMGFDFKREMQEDQQTFASGESEKQRTFTSGQAGEERAFRGGEAEKQRDFTADEAKKGRENQRGMLSNSERFTDANGLMWLRLPGGSLEPVMDPSGNQVKGVPPSGANPIEVGDPDSPTGTRMVPPSEAIGKPGKTGAKEMAESRAEDAETEKADARRQAETEAKGKAGVFSSDSSDFKESGGDREVWINRRAKEILAERKGGKKAAVTIDESVRGNAAGTFASESGGRGRQGAGYIAPSEVAAGAKKTVDQSYGGISTEKTMSVAADGKHYVIPTIVGGESYTPKAARDAFLAGEIKPLGIFDTEDDADRFAEQRSADLDAASGGRGVLRKGPSSPADGALKDTFAKPDAKQPPAEYPDAKWSDKVGAWVVQRNGKYYQVE